MQEIDYIEDVEYEDIILEPTAYSSHFKPLLESKDRYIVAFGGRGGGKSDLFYMKYILELFQPYPFLLAYVNKEKSNIRDQQYAGFKRVAKRCGLYDRLRFYDGDYRVVNPDNGNALIPKGMDDPEKTKGFDDVTAIWWDEVNKGDEEDFQALNELLRTPKSDYLQMAISFNPVSKKNWLYDYFFKTDFELKDKYAEKGLFHHSTYLNNDFIDKEEYLETLLISANGDPNKIRVNVKGEWGLEKAKNPFFDSIQNHNIGKTFYNKNDLIWLVWDFNKTASCLVVQHYSQLEILNSLVDLGFKRKDVGGVYVLKEFQANSIGSEAFMAMVRDVVNHYPNHYYMITGDASGINNTTGKINSFKLIENALYMHSISDNQFEIVGISHGNARHQLSHTVCNTVISHYQENFVIDVEGCPQLVEDVYQIQIKSNGKIDKDYEYKDSKGLAGHLGDCLRYDLINAQWDTYQRLSDMTRPLGG